MNHFKIIVPFYNVEKWIKLCIKSVKIQTYTNFQCILIDDISNDNTNAIVRDLIKDDDRFLLINNSKKQFALKNIIDGIDISKPSDEDVLITLDGDDWLYNEFVLQDLNDIYNEKLCQITYGKYVEYPSGTVSNYVSKYSDNIIKNNLFRNDLWKATHLRTFKYKLWKNIDQKDFLDEDKNYLDVTWDMAFMFPMLEMAGRKQECIDKILYVYNRDNPLSDDKIKRQKQLKYENIIRNRKKYNLLFED